MQRTAVVTSVVRVPVRVHAPVRLTLALKPENIHAWAICTLAFNFRQRVPGSMHQGGASGQNLYHLKIVLEVQIHALTAL